MTETDRQTDRQRQRETETDRQTHRQRQRQTETEKVCTKKRAHDYVRETALQDQTLAVVVCPRRKP